MLPIKYSIHYKSNYRHKKIYSPQVNIVNANADTDSILIYWMSKELLLMHMKLDTRHVDGNKNQNDKYFITQNIENQLGK